jgi:hypothetical protein
MVTDVATGANYDGEFAIRSCTPMYTAVVTRPILGARPFGASLRLFKIVPDDFVTALRPRLPALATFLKQLLRRWRVPNPPQ